MRPVHRSTSVGLLELGRLRGVEELGDELPYSFGVVFLEEVAAVWEGGELGFGVVALEAGHGFGDVGEDAVFFAVDEADNPPRRNDLRIDVTRFTS